MLLEDVPAQSDPPAKGVFRAPLSGLRDTPLPTTLKGLGRLRRPKRASNRLRDVKGALHCPFYPDGHCSPACTIFRTNDRCKDFSVKMRALGGIASRT